MYIAGTVVGIASLGMQVCHGLSDYYRECDSYYSDIKKRESVSHIDYEL